MMLRSVAQICFIVVMREGGVSLDYSKYGRLPGYWLNYRAGWLEWTTSLNSLAHFGRGRASDWRTPAFFIRCS